MYSSYDDYLKDREDEDYVPQTEYCQNCGRGIDDFNLRVLNMCSGCEHEESQ